MVGAVAGHHLVLRYAVKDSVNDGPGWRGLAPAAVGFFFRECDYGAAAEVDVERAGLDEDAAPDDFAGFANAFERASAQGEVHGGLALAAGAGVSAGEVIGGGCAGDLEDPDEVINA